MTVDRLALSLVSASLLLTSITACQPNTGIVEDKTISAVSKGQPVALKESIDKDSENLLTTLNRYQWQLVEVINDPQNKTVDNQVDKISNNTSSNAFRKKSINTQNPLTMDVQPSALLIDYGCQQYRLSYTNYYQPPFSYNVDYISDTTNTSCATNTSLKDKKWFKTNERR